MAQTGNIVCRLLFEFRLQLVETLMDLFHGTVISSLNIRNLSLSALREGIGLELSLQKLLLGHQDGRVRIIRQIPVVRKINRRMVRTHGC